MSVRRTRYSGKTGANDSAVEGPPGRLATRRRTLARRAAPPLVILIVSTGCALVLAADDADESPLFPESCEAARKNPRAVTYDDVRFVECDRRAPRSRGEAFSLGEPIYTPRPGPSPTEARWYAPGHCDHGGGSITAHNIYYQPEHIEVAIACSRKRCEAHDALGCRDLGELNWDTEFLPAVKKNEAAAVSAFKTGCLLGDAPSCMSLADIYDKKHDPILSLKAYASACEVAQPDAIACREVGERLIKEGKHQEGRRFLLRACRGTRWRQSLYSARREGCGLLAPAAAKRGDVASQREYLRLECAYGSEAPPACEQLGLSILNEGDPARALPYLRKACGILPDDQVTFGRACKALARLEKETPENEER